ncbi:hypothetical protein PPOP_3052, partial [Paenibacillus popilliae ATCC 14706]
GGENFHSTRIRPWALCFLFPEGVALHFTIRHIERLAIVIPTLSDSSVTLIFLLASITSILIIIAMLSTSDYEVIL